MQRKPRRIFLSVAVLAAFIATGGCAKLRARDKLNKGVNAYKAGQFDQAVEDFKEAREFDPTLTNAQLYLATAYATQYIPGAPVPENVRNGEEAVKEFQTILDQDPNSLPALDGIGSILFNMAGTPYDSDKLMQSKSFHEKHIQLKPDDPEPYYWVGVIDWTIASHGNNNMRDDYNSTAKKTVREGDPLPAPLVPKFAQQFSSTVDEGITNLKKAMDLRPDYDDAMAYLQLLYRQKADMETSASARAADVKMADDLVDQVKAIKQKNMQGAHPTS